LSKDDELPNPSKFKLKGWI